MSVHCVKEINKTTSTIIPLATDLDKTINMTEN